MTLLCDRRGELVMEDRRMRLGEVRFQPALDRAVMSAGTWQLIENDDEKARSYTTARARAMRPGRAPSAMSLMSTAERTEADALTALEEDVARLLSALHAVHDDASDFTAGDLLRRRQLLRAQLVKVRARVEEIGARFEVIDELLNVRVLA